MNIAIVGAGAIGGYLGVKLAQSGVDVTFVARGENHRRWLGNSCEQR
jgi:2-dehydropantoate 2-reductase